MIRVAVSARSAIDRSGLEALVRAAGFELVEHDADAEVLLAAADDTDELTAHPALPTVLVTGDDAVIALEEALENGIRSVLPRDAAPAEIEAAVRAVASGLVALRPEMLRAGARVQPAGEARDDPGPLSPREIEVLRMMAEGLPNKTIAWKLGISEHTVKFHVASILNRLNAGSRTEAVTIGIRRGLILL